MSKILSRSWETTLAGVGTIAVTIGNALVQMFDGDPATNVSWSVVIAGVTAGLGLIRARDNNKSSESAGAK